MVLLLQQFLHITVLEDKLVVARSDRWGRGKGECFYCTGVGGKKVEGKSRWKWRALRVN